MVRGAFLFGVSNTRSMLSWGRSGLCQSFFFFFLGTPLPVFIFCENYCTAKNYKIFFTDAIRLLKDFNETASKDLIIVHRYSLAFEPSLLVYVRTPECQKDIVFAFRACLFHLY